MCTSTVSCSSLAGIVAQSPCKVRVADSTNNEAKMKLAEIYEITNEPRKALTLVYEGASYSLELASSSDLSIQSLIPGRRSPEAKTRARRKMEALLGLYLLKTSRLLEPNPQRSLRID